MFTGIVEAQGNISQISTLGKGLECTIQAPATICRELKSGDSIAINGVCSTALNPQENTFTVQFLEETLAKTSFKELRQAAIVNLELSLTPNSRMGGHFVTGHVDDTGIFESIETDGPWGILTITYTPKFRYLLIPKGSVTIDGIALTLVDITETTFTCHIIPHTLDNTTLTHLKKNSLVNLEYDLLGKYLYNFSQYGEKK